MKQGNRPAGGLGSRVVKHSSNPKVEPRPRAVNPAAAGQLGTSLGDHATVKQSPGARPLKGAGQPVYGGPGYEAKGPMQGKVGVGGGRTIHKSGSQATHGPTTGQRPQPGNPFEKWGK
jgi:hypothetical protein